MGRRHRPAPARQSRFALHADFSAAIRLRHRRCAPRRLSRKKRDSAGQFSRPSAKIFDLKIDNGRVFNETDTEHRAPVVAAWLRHRPHSFPGRRRRAAVGQEVTIDGQLFTVIGTLEKRRQGISGGSNPEDNIAFMPVTTLRKLYPNQKDYVIFAKASDPASCRRSRRRNPRSAPPQAPSQQRQAGRFRDLHFRLFSRSLEQDQLSHLHSDVRSASGRLARRRHRRDEHHARQRHRTNARNRRAQSHRRETQQHPAAILDRSRHAQRRRRRYRRATFGAGCFRFS